MNQAFFDSSGTADRALFFRAASSVDPQGGDDGLAHKQHQPHQLHQPLKLRRAYMQQGQRLVPKLANSEKVDYICESKCRHHDKGNEKREGDFG